MTKDAWTVFQVPKGSDVSALHENVKKTWRFIFNDWFDNSGYVFDHTKFDLECYLGEETISMFPSETLISKNKTKVSEPGFPTKRLLTVQATINGLFACKL